MTSQTSLYLAALLTITLLTTACVGGAEKTAPPTLADEADTLISKGVVQYNQADYDKAAFFFDGALNSYRGIDNPEGIASSCINLAKTSLSQGDTRQAQDWLNITSTVVRNNNLVHLEARINIIQSSIEIENQNLAAAKQSLAALLEADNKSMDKATRVAAVQNRTRVAFLEGSDQAYWVQQFEQLAGNGNTPQAARLERFKAELSDNHAVAAKHYQAALDIYRTLMYRPGIAATLAEWAQSDIDNNQANSANNKLERALFIRTEMKDRKHSKLILVQYRHLFKMTGMTDSLNTTNYWLSLLESDDFNQWQNLAQAYSLFPAPK